MSNPIVRELRRAWSDSRPLTATCVLMLAAFVASVAGIFLDHRTITGVPAWLKPAKFAISTALFSGTLAWLLRYLTIWPIQLRTAGWTVGMLLTLEVAVIDVQAARGTTSHFNASSTLDAGLFTAMGIAIGIVWMASIVFLAALFRQRFADPAFGWSLRLGMLITILGCASGGLMVRATPQQVQVMHAGGRPAAVGAHTVGAPDGGPGLPGLGWSTQHGDLRVPHFFGLHGIQILPILYCVVLRRRRQAGQAGSDLRAVAVAAASYLAFAGILGWQALRGQSIVAPDRATLLAFGIWLALSVGGIAVARWPGKAARQELIVGEIPWAEAHGGTLKRAPLGVCRKRFRWLKPTAAR